MKDFGQNHYVKTDITTSDRGKLIVLLYEGAINFLNKAKYDIKEGNNEGKCNNINRAHDIIQELNFSLKMDEGGEIADGLRRLYQFMETHLIRAKIEKGGVKKIDEVISMLSTLNSAWTEVLKKPEVKDIRQVETSIYPGLSQGINV